MQIDRNQKVAPSTTNISLLCDKFAFGVAFSKCRRKNAFVVFLIQHRLKFEYWQPYLGRSSQYFCGDIVVKKFLADSSRLLEF